MNIADKAAKIMLEFQPFTTGVRVCMLIDRGKSNSNKGSGRWVSKLISTNREQLKENITKLLDQQEHLGNPDIRLYMCVNARNMDKAIIHFKHRQLDVELDGNKVPFYTRINDEFCSSLMKPENKDENYFLIDWDHQDQPVPAPYELFRYETPNGWHIITYSCYPELLGELKDSVKKDALLLLNVLDPKPDCSCYEVKWGHQPGCYYYKRGAAT